MIVRQRAFATDEARGRSPAQLLGILASRPVVLSVAALLLIGYFHTASGGLFVTATNASLLLRQTAVIAVLAAGVAVVIIMGEIDLSLGSAVFLTGLVAAQLQVAGWDVTSTILGAVAAGALIGVVQGVTVVRLGVPAFVVTLAGLLIWRGLGLIYTDAAAVGPVNAEFTALTEGAMPTWLAVALAAAVVAGGLWRVRAVRLAADGSPRATSVLAPVLGAVAVAAVLLWVSFGRAGLPNALLWIVVIGILLGVVLNHAKFGRRAFLVGSNREAALYAGISARRTLLAGFVLMGIIVGIGGVMLTARLGTSTADSGLNLELVAIAAAVIGGNSLRGGIGSVRGAILGAFLLATIDNGMSLLGVSSFAQNVVKGLILVLAVGLDGHFTRRRTAQ
jgi:ABC-type xylose transport system permease subunit